MFIISDDLIYVQQSVFAAAPTHRAYGPGVFHTSTTGIILNRTYGRHKNLPGIYFAIFTNKICSLLWSPVLDVRLNLDSLMVEYERA